MKTAAQLEEWREKVLRENNEKFYARMDQGLPGSGCA